MFPLRPRPCGETHSTATVASINSALFSDGAGSVKQVRGELPEAVEVSSFHVVWRSTSVVL